MAPTQTARNGVERVRHELLTALHFGRLTPGDRVPSVRSLANLTGMNRKTVHRAYTRLAGEGLLDLRPGSGTYVAERPLPSSATASANDLLAALNRSRALAKSLNVPDGVFGSFVDILMNDGLRDLPLIVTECNREQLGLLEMELRDTLGVAPQPMLLPNLAAAPTSLLRRSRGVITTHCHGPEVFEQMADRGVPVYQVALDPAFPLRLLDQARRGPILMVVRDRAFAPVFLKLLRQLGGSDEMARRFVIVEPMQARLALSRLPIEPIVMLSPLVRSETIGLPRQLRCLRMRWPLESGSVDRLRVSMALDVASRRRIDHPS